MRRADAVTKSLKALSAKGRLPELLAWSTAAGEKYVRMRYAMLFYSLLFTFVASPVLGASVCTNPWEVGGSNSTGGDRTTRN